jgi:hypothetical protein
MTASRTHAHTKTPSSSSLGAPLDTSIEASLSERRPHTARVYRSALSSLRSELRLLELDLDGPALAVAFAASVWLGTRADGRRASLSTQLQRRAAVSGWFAYARRSGLSTGDPMALIDRLIAPDGEDEQESDG